MVVGLLALASSAAAKQGMQHGGNTRTGHGLFFEWEGGIESLFVSFCVVLCMLWGLCDRLRQKKGEREGRGKNWDK